MATQRPLSLTDFIARFPDEDTCLEVVFRTRFGAMDACPKCKRPDPLFYRISTRRAYECGKCRKQIYPCAGTPMQGSQTRLTVWFQALFLMSISRNGVSAYELERALGVDYRTAWRIGNRVRLAMMAAMDAVTFSGKIEVDETLLGGVARGGKRGWGAANKVCLVGVVQRGGGVRTVPVPARNRDNILEVVRKFVQQGATVNTDEFRAYRTLPEEGYQHQSVVHSKYQWAQGDAHTNSIEGYWSNLKKSIRGTHTRVSPAYLSNYLAEFDYRHTNRGSLDLFEHMFLLLMAV